MRLWNREESFKQYSSPAPVFASELCNETNVVVFNEFYAEKGLNSKFSLTIPEGLLPTEADGSTASERGWASMDFYGELGLEYDVSDRVVWDRGGLPVTGWLFSIFNTNDNSTNHTTINKHKYLRSEICYRSP